ncbi:hypothetical protein Nepgr_023520 [Nepenthes gracilis]|uniref:Phytocyanin domain-containing protein n=1 Tax=Nepenthes gracilis TaxID=150966 RepID=A0AAD3T0V4_NEPGR|nr:hypothetical protein Nepgr_023520 [Nepenthes gracilis]
MSTPVAAIAILLVAAAATANAATYTNHTVGDPAVWFFNVSTNSSASNYSDWASTQTFNLGDYLIFNTTTNETVVQTTNATAYKSCSADDTSDDTSIYDSGSNVFGQTITIAVPLTIEGSNYFFSDPGDDGFQCERGMRFEIKVNHGSGLPPILNQPPPPPYAPPPASEPPPVFEGSGGGQGQSISGCWTKIGGGFPSTVRVAVAAILGLGMAV